MVHRGRNYALRIRRGRQRKKKNPVNLAAHGALFDKDPDGDLL